ncbi:MAG: D-alanyl-D-alanine carboxypeptidase family protein [Candidatus Zixiibacteriota bacterium]
MIKRWIQFLIPFVVLFLISRVPWGELFIAPDDVEIVKETDTESEEAIPLRELHFTKRAFENKLHRIRAKAALAVDVEKGDILFEKNMERPLPIASLTKLMTALVFLEQNLNLNDSTTITYSDAKSAGRSRLWVGETVSLKDLLHTSLVCSNNRTTKTLVRASGMSLADFVSRMNQKAKEIGLENTCFYEPTGLDEKNRSTALDCVKLLSFALRDSAIASITSKKFYSFTTVYKKRKRRHRIVNTNKLLLSSLNVKGGKTGYNGASGWCLGTLVEDKDGTKIAAVVLGAPTSIVRFRETRSIIKWSLQKATKGT